MITTSINEISNEELYEILKQALEPKEPKEIKTGFDAEQFEKLIERVRKDYKPIKFDQYGRIFF